MAISNFPRLRYSDVVEVPVLGTAATPATFAVAADAPTAEIAAVLGQSNTSDCD